ncbi:thiopeptide-type bacteriocin biosynthesis protein [Glutamicibacter halophytocola]|uniref:thiopeptide-type bacteriocin biosynthesis protein n=1 Tax=Glutamicibacter halophytocola TaxID=1933880 RepID=UPI00096B65B4|nr:thiopeptide-type bacteriocin biosynthesis protein [Glutamicibacter halophytocola]
MMSIKRMKPNSGWIVHDQVLARTPSLNPSSPALTHIRNDDIESLWKSKFIRDAIRQASPTLYAEICKMPKSGKKRDKIKRALGSYLLRMTTRPTPFGLQAAIGVADVEQPARTVAPKKLSVVDIAPTESRNNVLGEKNNLLVGINPSISIQLDTLKVIYQVPGQQKRIEIELDSRLSRILTHFKRPQLVKGAIASSSILKLIDIGLLVSNERPSIPNSPLKRAKDLSTKVLIWDNPPSISNDISERIAKISPGLAKLSSAHAYDQSVKEFIDKFDDKFSWELVPIDIVFDELYGIGTIADRQISPYPDFLDLQYDLYSRAKGSSSVELLDEDINKLTNSRNALDNFDIFVHIDSKNSRNISFSPRGLTVHAGRAWSRFSRYSDEFLAAVRHVNNLVTELDSKPVLLDYWHDSMIEISAGESNIEHVLAWSSLVGEDRISISIHDVSMRVRNGNVQFFDSRTLERIYFRTNHLVSTSSAPRILDSLYRLSHENLHDLRWNWWFKDFKPAYFPQITYKNVVISEEKWRVPSNIRDQSMLISWLKESGVPRKVRLDNDELGTSYDLNFSLDRDLLLQSLNDTDRYISGSGIDIWDDDGTMEVVFSVFKDRSTCTASDQVSTHHISDGSCPQESAWLSIHVPTRNLAGENLLLKRIYAEFVGVDWFFVRYNIPRRHLRVRISKSIPIDRTFKFFDFLVSRHLIPSYSMEVYTPEVGRFGGMEHLIEWEKYFVQDTSSILSFSECLNDDICIPQESDIAIFQASLEIFNQIISLCASTDRCMRILDSYRRQPKLLGKSASERRSRFSHYILNSSPGIGTNRLASPPAIDSKHMSDLEIFSAVHLHLNRLGFSVQIEDIAIDCVVAALRALCIRNNV